ncbi:MAG TPA: ribbon-helix-helix domain-containing protein [Verrucomicrobiae bacterium]
MSTISLKLPSLLARRLDAEAKKTGRSKSEIIREALEKSFRKPGSKKPSFYDITSHLAGSGKGPGDLSTNKKHLSDFGK